MFFSLETFFLKIAKKIIENAQAKKTFFRLIPPGRSNQISISLRKFLSIPFDGREVFETPSWANLSSETQLNDNDTATGWGCGVRRGENRKSIKRLWARFTSD